MIEGPRGQYVPPDLEEKVKRIQLALALIATELDQPSNRSVEEQLERILYPEHFAPGEIETGLFASLNVSKEEKSKKDSG